ncbi:hypothetical protein [Paenibacillus polymyxa]|uniref:Uncharacterized protein n=1 Tax=Paenibacillus polymyxa (strain SC2) TaxID=886882 RepID=E3ELD3_PAEPS|nr:hypothetical protein [Paenibacillus polymyxa]ADO59965.1 hypothetical protein PPSC2_28355 [Paenibacillus polymyxa SC2]WPQ59816.1 hypothetical protein SKN87_26365 [Paenibacillus polymyxa]
MWQTGLMGEYYDWKDENNCEVILVTGHSDFYLSSGTIDKRTIDQEKFESYLKDQLKQNIDLSLYESQLIRYVDDSTRLLIVELVTDDIGEINNCLKQKGLPRVFFPTVIEPSTKWIKSTGMNNRIVFVRKTDELTYETIHVYEHQEKYWINYRRNDFYELNEKYLDALEFVRCVGRNPLDDIEIEAYEVTTHGSSGMDKVYYDLKNEQEVKDILLTVYGIDQSWK